MVEVTVRTNKDFVVYEHSDEEEYVIPAGSRGQLIFDGAMGDVYWEDPIDKQESYEVDFSMYPDAYGDWYVDGEYIDIVEVRVIFKDSTVVIKPLKDRGMVVNVDGKERYFRYELED